MSLFSFPIAYLENLFGSSGYFTTKNVIYLNTILFMNVVVLNVQLRPNLIGDATDLGNNCFVVTADDFNQRGGI